MDLIINLYDAKDQTNQAGQKRAEDENVEIAYQDADAESIAISLPEDRYAQISGIIVKPMGYIKPHDIIKVHPEGNTTKMKVFFKDPETTIHYTKKSE